MRLIYIDESKDTQNNICAYSALCIHIDQWHQTFDRLVEFRKWLKDQYNLPMSFEMHASNLIAGRSRYLFNAVNSDERINIYRKFIQVAANLKNVKLLNTIGKLQDGEQFKVFEWLVSKLDKMLCDEDGYGVLICDEGDNATLTKMTRRMRKQENDEIVRIVEDPVFKKSDDSYFIQLVDFIVHAFLRFEHPIETKKFLAKIFMLLEPILYKNSSNKDIKNLGIIRVE